VTSAKHYVAPKFNAASFTCPHCGAFAAMDWDRKLYTGRLNWHTAVCAACEGQSLWKQECTFPAKGFEWASIGTETIVWPSVLVGPEPSSDMPEDARNDYEEARAVYSTSPRASAALLRLCIQRLCKHLGETGENLNNDIGALVSKGLPPQVQIALDSVRIIGNNAVHPGTIDDADMAEMLPRMFKAVGFIVQNRITDPKVLQGMFDSTPQGARDAVEERNRKALAKAGN